jgi:hypothetical protein
LTYVTLDQANGGVVRNLTHDGIGVQVVSAVRPRQQLQVRFELRYPKLRVEARAEVIWATFSGQCGMRFLDLSPRMSRQINEWIFGSLLEEVSLRTDEVDDVISDQPFQLGSSGRSADKTLGKGIGRGVSAVLDDGLLLSPAPLKVIELPARRAQSPTLARPAAAQATPPPAMALDWLSQPLSGRGLAWTIHALVVTAGLLLFALVFLSVTREAPRWPFEMAAGAALVVAALYWLFFQFFGGTSLGARLERLAGCHPEDDAEARMARFR